MSQDYIKSLEHLSLEELMEHVERTQQESNKRKEEIFNRVLDSLGGTQDFKPNYSDIATKSFLDSIQAKEDKKRKEEQRIKDLIEKEKIEKERQELKSRFDPESEHSKGINPLADLNQASNTDYIIPTETIQLESYLESDEFEVILSELEKELDSQALSKSEEPSELSEILFFLEQEASKPKSKKQITSSNYVQSDSSSTSLTMPPSPPPITSVRIVSDSSSNSNPQLKNEGVLNEQKQRSSNEYRRAKREVDSPNEVESENEDDEETDEDNWRKNRLKLKNTVSAHVEQPKISESSNKGFWGAYGTEKPINQSTEEIIAVDYKIDSAIDEESDTQDFEEEDKEIITSSFLIEEKSTQTSKVTDSLNSFSSPIKDSLLEKDTISINDTLKDIVLEDKRDDIDRVIDPPFLVSEKDVDLDQNLQNSIELAKCDQPQSILSGSLLLNRNASRKIRTKVTGIISSSKRTSKASIISEGQKLEPELDISFDDSNLLIQQSSIQEKNEVLPSDQLNISDVIDSGSSDKMLFEVLPKNLKPKFEITPAPTLISLPFSAVSERKNGIKIQYNWSTSFESIDINSLLICYINTNTIPGYTEFFSMKIINWIYSTLFEDFTLVGLWRAQNETQPLISNYRLIFQTNSLNESASASSLKRTLENINLSSLLLDENLTDSLIPELDLNTIKLEDLLVFGDYESTPQLVEQVLNEAKSFINTSFFGFDSPSLETDQFTLDYLSIQDLLSSSVCIMKDYVVYSPSGFNTIASLVQLSEKQGLRLVGFRLVYIHLYDKGTLKHYTNYDINTFFNNDVHPIPKPEAIGTLTPILALAFTSSKSGNATEILRNIIGPEDPTLAAKTDPLSLRSKFGLSKELNVVYSLPFLKEKVFQELKYWFGPRSEPLESDSSLNLITPFAGRKITVALKLQLNLSKSFSTHILSHYTTVQSFFFEAIMSKFQDFMYLVNVTSVDAATLASHLFNQQITSTESTPRLALKRETEILSDQSEIVSSCYLLTLFTYTSEFYLQNVWQKLSDEISKQLPPTYRSIIAYTIWMYNNSDQKSLMSESIPYPLLSSPLGAPQGSKLAAVQALKKIPLINLKSHEDVGMPDSVVIIASEPASISSIFTQKLHSITKFFPRTCEAYIISVKTIYFREEITNLVLRKILFVLRGFQIIENIDWVISEFKEFQQKAISSNKVICEDFHINYIKGMKALEVILSEFNLNNLFLDLSLLDLNNYVPNSHQLVPGGLDREKLSYDGVANLLFPPGNFHSVAVVVIPWLNISDSLLMRNLGCIVSRLEKEQFETLGFNAVSSFPIQTISDLCCENLKEYSYDDFPTWQIPSDVLSIPVMLILVHKRSALLKLKSAVGPILNDEIAIQKYPRSLTTLLNSLLTSSQKSKNLSNHFPWLIPSLSCLSTTDLVRKYFPAHYDLMQYLHTSSTSLIENDENDGIIDYSQEIYSRTTVDPILEKNIVDKLDGTWTIVTKSLDSNDLSSNIQTKSLDIAGVVVTSSLLKLYGLGSIIEALHREGLWIVNAKTSKLTSSMAKHLLEAAGVSSVSMRPSLNELISGPVVCFGVCGPSHSLIRFKSFSVTPKSNNLLWYLKNGEYGALSTSSTRLAKAIFTTCFHEILSEDCPFYLNYVS